MDDMPIRSRDEPEAQTVLAQFDGPAFVRRGREVRGAFEDLLARARQQRAEWLGMTRTRLGLLQGLAGSWNTLRPLLADEQQVSILECLQVELAPRLRVPVEPTTSSRVLGRSLRELIESLEYFNRRWLAFLPSMDLATVNALRADYNRFYVLEKECALASARMARQGFVRLEPLSVEDLANRLPTLPVPRLSR